MAGNGGDHNFGARSRVTFNTAETRKYIVHVTVNEYSEEKFTLSVECAASTCDKAKKKDRRNLNEADECPQCGILGRFTLMVLFGIYPNKLDSRHL